MWNEIKRFRHCEYSWCIEFISNTEIKLFKKIQTSFVRIISHKFAEYIYN